MEGSVASSAAASTDEEEHRAKLLLFYSQYLQAIARRARAKQRVARTALRFFRKVYTQTQDAWTTKDPLLYAPLALWVAAKAEEQFITASDIGRHLANIDGLNSPYSDDDLVNAELEFLEAIAFDLGSDQPPERQLACYLNAAQVDHFFDPTQLVANATFILNDLYRTDAPLLYESHLVALSSIFMAAGALGITLPEALSREISTVEHIVIHIADGLKTLYESAISLKGEERGHLRTHHRQLDKYFPRRRTAAH